MSSADVILHVRLGWCLDGHHEAAGDNRRGRCPYRVASEHHRQLQCVCACHRGRQ